MPRQSIDFRTIRSHNGSQHSGFEEFCCQLAGLDIPDRPFHRKGTGADAGVECYRVEANGSETGWQAKYFLEFGSSHVSQLSESFAHALQGHPNLTKYIVCLPTDLSDARVGNRKSERQRWDDWVARCVTAAAPRSVKIELWGAFELIERLGRDHPLYSGRRAFWFNALQFGPDWFQAQFEVARASLGQRYTPELNVELPIGRALAAFVRDPAFIREVEGWADRLDEAFHAARHYLRDQLGTTASEYMAQLEAAVPAIVREMRLARKGPADALPLDSWHSSISAAQKVLDDCNRALWEAPAQAQRARERDTAIHFAWRLRDALDDAADQMTSPSTTLANVRRLLVQGEAGVGKSHLLADVARRHIELGHPAVLVLGGSFSDAEPWTQILAQLGLGGSTPDEFLGALDAAAEASGARAVVMVDAINERQGIAVWAERLAAFLQLASRFPRIAIVISCRTTFLPYIVDHRLSEADLPRITHPGFGGRASEAARRYLDQRGIVRMAAPALAPEFENPLFLRTCCDLLERNGSTELPRGLSGVSAIFDFYFGAVAESLTLRMGLDRRFRIVERALDGLTARMVGAASGYLPIDDAIQLLEAIHPSQGHNAQSLLFQLESEGVIAVEPVEVDGNIVEHVRFTFERLSDHRIAARLLDDQVGDSNPAPAFADGGALQAFVQGRCSHRFAGIAEAFAVQLPERYGVELIDVIHAPGARWDLWHAFEVSLLWRQQKTFTKRTLELVHDMDRRSIGSNALLSTLLSIATEPDNLYNANHLDTKLSAMAMPERDQKWSIHVARLADDDANPVETLVEWTLANALHPMDPARARLVALSLSWLLSLSHRSVRDRATKALAALLVTRRPLAAELIGHFAEIDDAYILDRVLAAAYGGALRNQSNDGLAELATAAFEAVFAREHRPDHALIRDHARGIVELAAARSSLPSGLDPDKARPPYPGARAIETIGDEMIEGFKEDLGRGAFHDAIFHSAISDGDFARYEIDRMAGRFLALPLDEVGRTSKQIFERWRRASIEADPNLAAAFGRVLQASQNVHALPSDWDFWDDDSAGPRPSKEERDRLEAERKAAEEELERLLGETGAREYRTRAAGHVREGAWDPEAIVWRPTHQGEQARRWVGWRAHQLGWTAERFGSFDREAPDRGRMDHRIERIGKKYQWIALHELAGRLSDGYALSRGWREEPAHYQGPWEIDLREMDPSMLVTATPNRERSDQPATWWAPHAPRWRLESPEGRRAWMMDRARDIPDPIAQIGVSDRGGRQWLVLQTSMSRNQWHMADGDRVAHRMTWHKIRCLLVPRGHRLRLVALLVGSERDRDHPPEVDLSSDAYLGEYAWHPSCAGANGSWTLKPPRGKVIEVHATVVDRYIERSGHDYSIEADFSLAIPGPMLMANLDLRLAEGRSLAFAQADGKVIFKDPSAEEPGFSAAVVDREAFTAFLNREGLEAVWIITGEKSAHGGPSRGEGWGGHLEYWGIYALAQGALAGDLEFRLKQPSREQLNAYLAGA